MISEFPGMAVEIMRELAHRLEATPRSCAKPATVSQKLEPAGFLYPPGVGAARLPESCERADR